MLLAAPAAVAAEPVILVLGDSLSAGYGVPRGAGWVDLLGQRLRERGYRYQVVNGAISGETSRGGAGRLPAALERLDPKILIVALGGNDGLRGIPPAEMRRNLGRIIEAARAEGSKVLLVGVRIPPNYGPAFTEQFTRSFRQVAIEYDVPLVPRILEGVATSPELMQNDGIHPNAQAQPRILDNVWPGLEPLLQAPEGSRVGSSALLRDSAAAAAADDQPIVGIDPAG